MNVIKRTILILFFIFSFYYTNKVVDFLKENDPIMKSIKNDTDRYMIDPVDALIDGNSISSGRNGKTIDYDSSYNKMKKYGAYNESLIVIKDVIPTISINDNYDRYVVGGNKSKRKIALVFKVFSDDNPLEIVDVLNKKNVVGTFFIDGTYLEKKVLDIKKIKKNQLEILSYNLDYNESLFKTSISYLNSLTSKKAKFCYTEYDNRDLLDLCKKLKMHTIKPYKVLDKNVYKEIKQSLSNSIIFSFEINNNVLNDLAVSIDYIKSRGYEIVSLSELLLENDS